MFRSIFYSNALPSESIQNGIPSIDLHNCTAFDTNAVSERCKRCGISPQTRKSLHGNLITTIGYWQALHSIWLLSTRTVFFVCGGHFERILTIAMRRMDRKPHTRHREMCVIKTESHRNSHLHIETKKCG